MCRHELEFKKTGQKIKPARSLVEDLMPCGCDTSCKEICTLSVATLSPAMHTLPSWDQKYHLIKSAWAIAQAMELLLARPKPNVSTRYGSGLIWCATMKLSGAQNYACSQRFHDIGVAPKVPQEVCSSRILLKSPQQQESTSLLWRTRPAGIDVIMINYA